MTRVAAQEATRTRGGTHVLLHLRIRARLQQCGENVALTLTSGDHQCSPPILRTR